MSELDDLKREIGELKALIKLQDFQQKLIIKNFNKLFSMKQFNITENVEVKSVVSSVVDEKPISASEELIEKKNKLMKVDRRIQSTTPPPSEDDQFEFKVSRNSPDLNKNMPQGKKVPISQKVIVDDIPLVNANVKIKSNESDFSTTIKTNTSGIWQSVLPAGNYDLNVSGKTENESIEYSQSFEIPPIDSSITIPTPEFFRRKKLPKK